ncbi:MAG: peptidoglycan editing factor PgeF [Calditrichaeota bacterium]|nr:MAG: peptidoglycan editing factor PgeF [Calditrichota bacterium]
MFFEEVNGLKILKSEIFSKFPELKFGFSTKQGGFSEGDFSNLNLSLSVEDEEKNVLKNRNLFFSSLGIEQSEVVLAGQVHEDKIVCPQNFGLQRECDGLVTNQANTFLTLTAADCYCIFFYEPVKKVVCGVHSGWRGTVAEISKKAVQKLVTEFGCERAEILAFVTPGISQENFEVGEEVAQNFEAKFIKRKSKPFVDLEKIIVRQLEETGIRTENIETSNFCTFGERELFFSHRRDKGKTGRMFGVIGFVSD